MQSLGASPSGVQTPTEVAGSRFGAVSAGRSRMFPVALGFLSADPEGSPHGSVTAEPGN